MSGKKREANGGWQTSPSNHEIPFVNEIAALGYECQQLNERIAALEKRRIEVHDEYGRLVRDQYNARVKHHFAGGKVLIETYAPGENNREGELVGFRDNEGCVRIDGEDWVAHVSSFGISPLSVLGSSLSRLVEVEAAT